MFSSYFGKFYQEIELKSKRFRVESKERHLLEKGTS